MDLDNVPEQPLRAKFLKPKMKVFTCKRCQKIYQNLASFEKHQCYICDNCNKLFSSSQRLRSHISFCFHDHMCELCKRMFNSPNNLKNHVCTYCVICKRQFASGQRFRTHKCINNAKFKADQWVTDMMKNDTKKFNVIKNNAKVVSILYSRQK